MRHHIVLTARMEKVADAGKVEVEACLPQVVTVDFYTTVEDPSERYHLMAQRLRRMADKIDDNAAYKKGK